MKTHESPDIEPEQPSGEDYEVNAKKPSNRKSFSKLRRELSDEELTSPAVQRLLLDEIERLDEERSSLSVLAEKFHNADKEAGILKERLKSKVSIDILHISCMTIGAAALTYAPGIWGIQPTATIACVFGTILIIAGLAAKAIKP